MSFCLSLRPVQRLEQKLELRHNLSLQCNICEQSWAPLFDHTGGVVNESAALYLVEVMSLCPCCFSGIDPFNTDEKKNILKRFARFHNRRQMAKEPIPEYLVEKVPPGAAVGAIPLDW